MTLLAPSAAHRALLDDERILVLLGLLSGQGRPGYQLSEIIEHQLRQVIQLKKGTAYLLLDRLEQHGLIASRTEQPGLRPIHKVYSLTPAGERHFQALLTCHLEEEPSLLPGNMPLMFSEHLPGPERLGLLRARLGPRTAGAPGRAGGRHPPLCTGPHVGLRAGAARLEQRRAGLSGRLRPHQIYRHRAVGGPGARPGLGAADQPGSSVAAQPPRHSGPAPGGGPHRARPVASPSQAHARVGKLSM